MLYSVAATYSKAMVVHHFRTVCNQYRRADQGFYNKVRLG